MIREASALALLFVLVPGCDWFTPRPPRGSFTPGPSPTATTDDCALCGTSQRSQAVIYHVAAPAKAKKGQAVPFTIYAATGTDKAIICESALPRADMPGWGVDAKAKKLKLGLTMSSVVRDESRPCAVIDRAAPPKSVKATRNIIFPEAGTYTIDVAGFDGTRPLGMQYEPGEGDPAAPPKPGAPSSIEVTE